MVMGYSNLPTTGSPGLSPSPVEQVHHYIAKSWTDPDVKISVETMSKGDPKITVEIKGNDEKDIARRVTEALTHVKAKLKEAGYSEAS